MLFSASRHAEKEFGKQNTYQLPKYQSSRARETYSLYEEVRTRWVFHADRSCARIVRGVITQSVNAILASCGQAGSLSDRGRACPRPARTCGRYPVKGGENRGNTCQKCMGCRRERNKTGALCRSQYRVDRFVLKHTSRVKEKHHVISTKRPI
jgi:hypothetical protein